MTRCWQVREPGSLRATQCVALIASWCQSFSTFELQVRWKPISGMVAGPNTTWQPGLGRVICHVGSPSPPPTTHHCLKQDIKYSIQELSSAISRSRRVWWTCGPTSGRCTSSMPSSSPIPLIRWCSGAVYSNRNLCFFTGHHQHLQGSAWSENCQTWRAGLSQIYNFCPLNARGLRFFTKLYF